MIVFIPSRNRAELALRAVEKWQEQEADEIWLVVEQWDSHKYDDIAEQFKNTAVLVLPKSGQGINYARQYIVLTAHNWGFKRIIMSDDDIFPRPESNVERLFEWEGLNTLGIGIMVPFYGLMFGNQTIKEEDRPLMSKGALGKRCFSLNVPRVLAAGNFDPRLHSGWGDDELVRDGMARLHATWYVHAGVHGVSTANRYTKGGINDFHHEDQVSRLQGQDASHDLIFKKWGPKYVSMPGKRMMFKWKLFMEDYVPNWQQRIDWVKK